ncbi:MAG: hypothetical protein J2P57_15220 [Acidimicrobiaceae bacterium]|nr:hypothetical protein [Acidimicrobiaceae bacterium]
MTRLTHNRADPTTLSENAFWEVRQVQLSEVIDDGFLSRYRALLDAEDMAFDELEHAFEDGDRAHFDADLKAWRSAMEQKLCYLHRLGVVLPPAIA